MEEKLRQDFPIDWDEDNYVSRREFFKFLTLASGGFAAGSAVLAAGPSAGEGTLAMPRKRIAAMLDVPVGESVSFNYPGKDDLCILVHNTPGVFDAFSRRCTHLSCPVQYQADRKRLYCPCHNGAFSLSDGSPTQGPPTARLKRVTVEVQDGEIYATGVEK